MIEEKVLEGERRARSDAPYLTPAEVAEVYKHLGVSEHVILELPSVEVAGRVLGQGTEGERAEFIEWLKRRERRIELAGEDPLGWGFEAETWRDADGLLEGTWKRRDGVSGCRGVGETGPVSGDGSSSPRPSPPGEGVEGAGRASDIVCDVLAIFGGNRAQKSFYAVKRICQVGHWYPRGVFVIGADSETASVATVQKYVWLFLAPHYKHLNGRRDSVFKVNYSQAEGFTNRKLVLPNGSEFHFATYNQDPGMYEGWELGAPVGVYEEVSAKRKAAGEFVPPNVGAVMDENMTLKWLKMLARRVRYRKSKVLWPFTPVRGITPAIKEVVGSSAVTLESRRSELLPRRNLADLPVGEMPYIRRCMFQRSYAIYFFTVFNKWGPGRGRSYYDEVKGLCEGKESQYVERVAYGFARDSVARAFPRFGPWNIVRPEQVPLVGTNYFFCDPAGARNWFMLWVRVCPVPGGGVAYYIYRDWPDCRTYGEWAVATEREVDEVQMKGWDGDAGPAQNGLGMGVTKYVELIFSLEGSSHAETRRGGGGAGEIPSSKGQIPKGEVGVRQLGVARGAQRSARPTGEVIAERYVDPRAGRSEHIAEAGGTCIIEEFEEAGMLLVPASGVNEEEGLTAVNELLDWNQDEPLCAVTNQPHLFVSEGCEQVRWMFENYTGRGGQKGACKDPADLARYMALAKLEYVGSVRRGREGAGF